MVKVGKRNEAHLPFVGAALYRQGLTPFRKGSKYTSALARKKMPIRYDQDSDTLAIILGPKGCNTYSLATGDFEVVVDEGDGLVEIKVSNASRFVTRAVAAGAQVERTPQVDPPQGGMVWYDADSSMISAFGYDEVEGILDVAFLRTGVYRYYEVPLHIFEGLRDASSKGSYIRNYIIDLYAWEKKRGRLRR